MHSLAICSNEWQIKICYELPSGLEVCTFCFVNIQYHLRIVPKQLRKTVMIRKWMNGWIYLCSKESRISPYFKNIDRCCSPMEHDMFDSPSLRWWMCSLQVKSFSPLHISIVSWISIPGRVLMGQKARMKSHGSDDDISVWPWFFSCLTNSLSAFSLNPFTVVNLYFGSSVKIEICFQKVSNINFY